MLCSASLYIARTVWCIVANYFWHTDYAYSLTHIHTHARTHAHTHARRNSGKKYVTAKHDDLMVYVYRSATNVDRMNQFFKV